MAAKKKASSKKVASTKRASAPVKTSRKVVASNQAAAASTPDLKNAPVASSTSVPVVNHRLQANYEPVEKGDSGTPTWLFILLAALVFWGDLYFVNNGGSFDSNVYLPYRNDAELEALAAARDPEKLFVLKGKTAYNVCAACHQSSGLGQPGLNPPLAGSDWVNGVGPNRMIRIVLNGLQGPISVNGTEYNGVMPGLGAQLNDEQIASILTYVRTNEAWGNSSDKVTPEQVAAIRASTASRGGASWTAAELLQIPHSD